MTARDKLDRHSAASATERVALLVKASAILASVDHEGALAELTPLVVPSMADWWAVDLLEQDASLRRVVSHSADGLAEQLRGRYLYWPNAPAGPFHIIRTEHLKVSNAPGDPSEFALSPDPEHLEKLRRLCTRAWVCVPLTFRGQALGAMTIGRTSDAIRPLHVALARTLARRIAQAVWLGRMYEELRDANRRKDEFLAMLGHELRNPLSAINNAVAVLESGKLSREAERPIQAIIGRQVQHLTKLIGDLLDVSRFNSGKIVLEREPIDLLIVAERCLATIREAGKGAGHDIELKGESVAVFGDPVRLEQVLDNLIDNSVKYTPSGGRITISIAARDGNALVSVRDTGAGIPPELLPHIFELFTQGTQGRDRRAGGLGVGLAIVKAVVDLHGGTVHATSQGPGAGTEVTVRLPRAESSERSESSEQSESSERSESSEQSESSERSEPLTRKHRVLVVEDNADTRETMRLLLEFSGHQVQLAESGPAGLDLAIRMRPDVALIDLGLPGMDGFEVARRVRAMPEGIGIRLVAVTGYNQHEDHRRASEAGFHAFLVKPVDRHSLDKAIFGRGTHPSRGAWGLLGVMRP